MPAIPKGAKTPADRKQSDNVKSPEKPDGWDLLRDPMDIEYAEQMELMAIFAEIEVHDNQVEINAQSLRTIGVAADMLQNKFAKDPTKFRAWIKELPFMKTTTERLLPLMLWYMDTSGEAPSSAS
jgi:hypothetical protein